MTKGFDIVAIAKGFLHSNAYTEAYDERTNDAIKTIINHLDKLTEWYFLHVHKDDCTKEKLMELGWSEREAKVFSDDFHNAKEEEENNEIQSTY